MVKRISILLIIILSVSFLTGCFGNSAEKEKPPQPGEKKKAPAPTYVPSSMTPEQYLEKYYGLYTTEKYDESYKMLPSTKKEEQSLEEYKTAHKSLPAESYELGKKTEKGSTAIIEVKLNLKDYGPWSVTWQFEKKGKRYIVDDYSASGSSTKKSE